MDAIQVLGFILLTSGAAVCFFARRLFKAPPAETVKDGDAVEVLTPRAIGLKLAGLAAAVIGTILIFA